MMDIDIEFEVVGLPAPQGSKKHVGRGIMVESSKALKPWRSDVKDAARHVMDDIGPGLFPLDEPLHLHIEFRFPMPKSRPAKLRHLGRAPKTTRPDLEKLVRGVCDALEQSGMVKDDAVISAQTVTKREYTTGWHGALVRLEPDLGD